VSIKYKQTIIGQPISHYYLTNKQSSDFRLECEGHRAERCGENPNLSFLICFSWKIFYQYLHPHLYLLLSATQHINHILSLSGCFGLSNNTAEFGRQKAHSQHTTHSTQHSTLEQPDFAHVHFPYLHSFHPVLCFVTSPGTLRRKGPKGSKRAQKIPRTTTRYYRYYRYDNILCRLWSKDSTFPPSEPGILASALPSPSRTPCTWLLAPGTGAPCTSTFHPTPSIPYLVHFLYTYTLPPQKKLLIPHQLSPPRYKPVQLFTSQIPHSKKEEKGARGQEGTKGKREYTSFIFLLLIFCLIRLKLVS
jgi:hypothetical protein